MTHPAEQTLVLQPAVVPKTLHYGRAAGWLVLACSLLRLLLAGIIELGNDEAYYWLYTQQLQWNYFDHPPMVALLGRLFTANNALQEYEVFVRLGPIVCCALSSLFMYQTAATLHSPKAGWYAVVLYNTSFYAGMVAGLLLMPDSPQMVFWTASLWMLARLLRNERGWSSWLLFGLAAGLCIMSKVHGVFLWGGLGLFILWQKRAWLRLTQLYAAALVSLVVISPILIWNAEYDFVTYRFHSERVVVAGKGINWRTFSGEVWGQVFFNNPVNVALSGVALAAFFRRIRQVRPNLWLFVCIGLPLAAVLLFLSLFRTVYPHWSGPAYVTLMPIAALYLARIRGAGRQPVWLRWSLGALLVFSLSWPLVTHFYPGTWGSKRADDFGSGDVTLDRLGWEDSGEKFGTYYNRMVASGAIPEGTPLVCNTWWGAHVEYYFARPHDIPMIGLGPIRDIHHYAWLNHQRKDEVAIQRAFTVVPADEYFDVAAHYSRYYQNIRLQQTMEVSRSGQKAKLFRVYYLSGWKGLLPVMK
ncbi:ArnT family glycosyltransferase [Pseudocnuella soli]|uniref:ArnT family glycosyltransferase n=1 Tax=Pseudocnuella soli TaxID=2502779 RepID=UPI0010501D42|nr:glycosyltransferase family 39 protein [Pseudocnuella soli]